MDEFASRKFSGHAFPPHPLTNSPGARSLSPRNSKAAASDLRVMPLEKIFSSGMTLRSDAAAFEFRGERLRAPGEFVKGWGGNAWPENLRDANSSIARRVPRVLWRHRRRFS